jgi:threonine dehydrogenase-like Zn-dependent dehydrogenase
MLAMTYCGPKKIRLDHKPMPEIEHPGDAVIRVERAAICGSDVHIFHGLLPDTRVGATFGHEFVGVVEEIGNEVRNLKVGDRVLVPFNIACGTCPMCSKSIFGNCDNANPNSTIGSGIYGYSHTTGGYDGGQAEYVRVPFADVGPMIIPDDLHVEDALLCTDVFPTGYQAAEMGDIEKGDTVVVFGAGPVGLLAARSAWFFGAGRVIIVDHLQYRLDFAKTFAFAETFNFDESGDCVSELRKMTGDLGPDVCIDAVGCEAEGSFVQTLTGKLKLQAGTTTSLHWAINAVRKAGNISIVGVYGPPFNAFPVGTAVNKGLTLRMNQANVKRYLPHLIEHIRAGRISPKDIITHRLPLEEVVHGYNIMANRKENCIKPILIPPKAMATYGSRTKSGIVTDLH